MCDEELVHADLRVDDMDDPGLPVKKGLVRPEGIGEGLAELKRPVGDACPVCGSKKIGMIDGQDYGAEWDDPTHYHYTPGSLSPPPA